MRAEASSEKPPLSQPSMSRASSPSSRPLRANQRSTRRRSCSAMPVISSAVSARAWRNRTCRVAEHRNVCVGWAGRGYSHGYLLSDVRAIGRRLASASFRSLVVRIMSAAASPPWRRLRGRRRAAAHPDHPAHCQALDKDREHHHKIGKRQHQTARVVGWDRQRHGYRDAAAQSAPGEHWNRSFRLRCHPAERPDDSRDT